MFWHGRNSSPCAGADSIPLNTTAAVSLDAVRRNGASEAVHAQSSESTSINSQRAHIDECPRCACSMHTMLSTDYHYALIIDIYLNDPVVDWVKGSEKKSMGALEDEKYSSGWEPGRRIAHAKKKLNRISPVLLLKAELAINPRCIKSDTVRHLHKMLDPMLSRDATTLDTSLEISDQVDELIRLATDPDILARQWCGLATWI
jgi:hypothetical protein